MKLILFFIKMQNAFGDFDEWIARYEIDLFSGRWWIWSVDISRGCLIGWWWGLLGVGPWVGFTWSLWRQQRNRTLGDTCVTLYCNITRLSSSSHFSRCHCTWIVSMTSINDLQVIIDTIDIVGTYLLSPLPLGRQFQCESRRVTPELENSFHSGPQIHFI